MMASCNKSSPSPLIFSTYPVADDDAAFEQAVTAIVGQIEHDLQSYGDSDENPLNLKNVEFKIQTNRILNLLDMTIENIEIAFCLPLIANQSKHKSSEVIALRNQTNILELYEKLNQNEECDNKSLLDCINKTREIYNDLVPQFIKQVIPKKNINPILYHYSCSVLVL